ncbi:glycosyltransferase family 4 protein [Magnetofaba australis]|uniref:Putative group 1 glycosyl transferase n=1 Tax=Magnetofaba australis IT-1 TaxID=1434232 RepID=A0A1Y2K8Q7_9PROT|nr:glycosyltransferase family 4 protein [Magnetofaba australis]OSM05175.1 putative group 1 glycosyl transferase [Magnetofaba australis IT-1]
MRIALVLMRYNPFGGFERQAALLARHLLDQGHAVTLICARWRGELPDGARSVTVPFISGASWLKVWSFARGVSAHLQQHGGEYDRVIAFERAPGADLYRAGSACHRSWLALRAQQGGWRDALSRRINPLHGVINGVERRIAEDARTGRTRIITLAPSGAAQWREYYPIPPERFAIIPPALDFSRFDNPPTRQQARATWGLAESDPVWLHVGSGFRIKRLGLTIAALAQAPLTHLLVAGRDKKLQRPMQALAQEWGVAERVHFLGGVDDVAACYAAADLLVLPTLLDTFGAVTAEALFMGLPVAVGEGAGSAALIGGDARIGRTLPQKITPEALAQSCAQLLQAEQSWDEQQRDDARQTRRQAAMSCAPQRVFAAYEALLNSI